MTSLAHLLNLLPSRQGASHNLLLSTSRCINKIISIKLPLHFAQENCTKLEDLAHIKCTFCCITAKMYARGDLLCIGVPACGRRDNTVSGHPTLEKLLTKWQ